MNLRDIMRCDLACPHNTSIVPLRRDLETEAVAAKGIEAATARVVKDAKGKETPGFDNVDLGGQ